MVDYTDTPSIPVRVDGEAAELITSLEFTVGPRALRLLQPSRNEPLDRQLSLRWLLGELLSFARRRPHGADLGQRYGTTHRRPGELRRNDTTMEWRLWQAK